MTEENETVDGLTRLSQLADELADAEAKVATLSADLKAAQAEVQALQEKRIPELMDSLGMAEFKTKAGWKVTVTDKLSAKKLTEKHQAALQWLRDHGQGGMIKTLVGVPFVAGSESSADTLLEQLAGEGYIAAKSVEVHHSTLAAAVKSMLESGVDVPMELLGAYQRKVATITR